MIHLPLKSKPLTLIVFDLDGTLIDSKADIAHAVNFALAKEGLPTLPTGTIEGFVGRGMLHLIRDAVGNPDPKEIQKVAENFWDHYMEHLLDETVLYPGVTEFLEKFTRLKKAVVTNKPYAFSKKILEGFQIDHHFRWLIGGDTLGVQKPSPEVLNPIFEEMGRKPRGLVVGDSQIDIDCGRGAGLLTCGVTYGYRNREEIVAASPDYLIDRFEELSELPILQGCKT